MAHDVELYPDAYQYERAQRLGVSESCVRAALKRLKTSCKKTLEHPKANADAQQAFQERMKTHAEAGKTTVFVDESGFAHDMSGTHGYAHVGERCFGKHDWHAKGRTNVIGALLVFCLLTVTLFTGSVNSDVFFAWITQDLIPKLPKNSVIVMDNAAFHKRDDIKQAIVDAGHILEFLPPYSPDLNPIEHKWAQAKAIRRRCHCSVDEVFQRHNLYNHFIVC